MSESFQVRMPPDVQSIQIGEHQLVFIDDFLEDPEALLEVACRSRFEPYPGLDQRKGYPGIRAEAPAGYSQNLTALMDPLIRLNFGVPEALPLRKSICAFSLTTTAPEALGTLQRTPHFDASTPHHMAVLLYLCDEQQGGRLSTGIAPPASSKSRLKTASVSSRPTTRSWRGDHRRPVTLTTATRVSSSWAACPRASTVWWSTAAVCCTRLW